MKVAEKKAKCLELYLKRKILHSGLKKTEEEVKKEFDLELIEITSLALKFTNSLNKASEIALALIIQGIAKSEAESVLDLLKTGKYLNGSLFSEKAISLKIARLLSTNAGLKYLDSEKKIEILELEKEGYIINPSYVRPSSGGKYLRAYMSFHYRSYMEEIIYTLINKGLENLDFYFALKASKYSYIPYVHLLHISQIPDKKIIDRLIEIGKLKEHQTFIMANELERFSNSREYGKTLLSDYTLDLIDQKIAKAKTLPFDYTHLLGTCYFQTGIPYNEEKELMVEKIGKTNVKLQVVYYLFTTSKSILTTNFCNLTNTDPKFFKHLRLWGNLFNTKELTLEEVAYFVANKKTFYRKLFGCSNKTIVKNVHKCNIINIEFCSVFYGLFKSDPNLVYLGLTSPMPLIKKLLKELTATSIQDLKQYFEPLFLKWGLHTTLRMLDKTTYRYRGREIELEPSIITDTARMYFQLSRLSGQENLLNRRIQCWYSLHQQFILELSKINYKDKKLYQDPQIIHLDRVSAIDKSWELIIPDNYSILKYWGEAMQNCIASYADYINNREGYIILVACESYPAYGIQIENSQIIQFKGYRNSPPDEKLAREIIETLRYAGLLWGRYFS